MFVVFANMITSRLGASVNKRVMDLARATLKGDAEGVGEALEDLLKESISSRILTDERPYEAFISGLLMALLGNYEVTADFESGEGYHDVRLKRVRGGGVNVVIEVKHSRGEATPEAMQALAREALRQIHDRDYAHGMTGRVLSYGVAFDGKVPVILMDEETRRALMGAHGDIRFGASAPPVEIHSSRSLGRPGAVSG